MGKTKAKDFDVELVASSLKERTYYQVQVSFSSGNSMHRSIMCTDFGDGPERSRKVTPKTRIYLFNSSYEDEVERTTLASLHNLIIEKELFSK